MGTTIDFVAAAAFEGRELYDGRPHGKLRSIRTAWSPLPFHFVAATEFHQHISFPLDGETGQARLDLVPDAPQY